MLVTVIGALAKAAVVVMPSNSENNVPVTTVEAVLRPVQVAERIITPLCPSLVLRAPA